MNALYQYDGLAQNFSNSIAKALELLQSCAKPLNTFIANEVSCELWYCWLSARLCTRTGPIPTQFWHIMTCLQECAKFWMSRFLSWQLNFIAELAFSAIFSVTEPVYMMFLLSRAQCSSRCLMDPGCCTTWPAQLTNPNPTPRWQGMCPARLPTQRCSPLATGSRSRRGRYLMYLTTHIAKIFVNWYIIESQSQCSNCINKKQ